MENVKNMAEISGKRRNDTKMIVGKVGNILRQIGSILNPRRDSAPINDVAGLKDFAITRAAFVAQKSLYGYLKTRMGTRYPTHFEDDVFARSINIAKFEIFAACLSDITVFAVAHGLAGQHTTNKDFHSLALTCYKQGLDRNIKEAEPEFSPENAIKDFKQRLKTTDWQSDALKRENFTCSPAALVKWAPVSDQFKMEDTVIVENSIKFAWADIRRKFLKRLEAASISLDFKANMQN